MCIKQKKMILPLTWIWLSVQWLKIYTRTRVFQADMAKQLPELANLGQLPHCPIQEENKRKTYLENHLAWYLRGLRKAEKCRF